MRLRFAGIDATETAKHGEPGQPFSEEAKQFVSTWLDTNAPDGHIQIKNSGQGYYGRSLSLLSANGRSLNADLVSAGLAYANDPKGTYGFKILEDEAKRKKIGIWSDPAPTPPSVFRKEYKYRPDRRGRKPFPIPEVPSRLLGVASPVHVSENSSVGEAISAGIFQMNSLTNLGTILLNSSFKSDPSFDPREFLKENPVYKNFQAPFLRTHSASEAYSVAARIDAEMKYSEQIANGGLYGTLGQFVGAALDPLYLIPFIGEANGWLKAGGFVVRAGKMALAGATAEALPEAIRYSAQELRTPQDSLEAIGMAAVFTGVIGGGLAAHDIHSEKVAQRKVIDNFTNALRTDPTVVDANSAIINNLATDAVEHSPTLINYRSGKEANAKGEAKLKKKLHERYHKHFMGVRDSILGKADLSLTGAYGLENFDASVSMSLMNSPSTLTKHLAGEFFDTTLLNKTAESGVDSLSHPATEGSVVSRSKEFNNDLYHAISELDNDATAFSKKADITPDEYKHNVGRALLLDDAELDPLSKVIDGSVSRFRDLLIKLNNRLDEAGVIKTSDVYAQEIYGGVPEVDFKKSSVRVYNTDAIRANPDRFFDLINKSLKKTAGNDEIHSDTAENIFRNAVDTPNLRDINIRYMVGNNVHAGLQGLSNSDLIDFLHTDPAIIAETYVKRMAADLALTESFGDVALTKPISAIHTEFKILKQNPELSEKSIKALSIAEKNATDNIILMAKVFRGEHVDMIKPDGFFSKFLRNSRKANVLRLLGSQTLSAFSDPGMVAMINGLKPVYKGLKLLVTAPKIFKLTMAQAKLNGAVWEMCDTMNRINMVADIHQPFRASKGFEHILDREVSRFSVLNLMAPWNQKLKEFSGMATSHRILSNIKSLTDGKLLSPKTLARFRMAGLSDRIVTGIRKEIQAGHVDFSGDVILPNTHLWEESTRVAFRSAIMSEIDRAIVTPGLGDMPAFLHKGYGIIPAEVIKTALQFKSFAISAHTRMLVAGLQFSDMQVLNGLLLSTALGMAAYGAKQFVKGRAVSSDPKHWIREGLDRSGVFGVLGDVYNSAERLVYSGALNSNTSARYLSRNAAGVVGGPTAGFGESVFKAAHGIYTGKPTTRDITAMRKLFPYQNIFYFNLLIGKLEQKVKDKNKASK